MSANASDITRCLITIAPITDRQPNRPLRTLYLSRHNLLQLAFSDIDEVIERVLFSQFLLSPYQGRPNISELEYAR